MKEYPKGAIKSINELLTLKDKTVYEASNEFKHIRTSIFTGEIGVSKSGMYYWDSKQNTFLDRNSLLDSNVIENNYNDWFLFSNIEDAREYLGKCRHCGK